jgi:membrane-bound ClpP family serine protease
MSLEFLSGLLLVLTVLGTAGYIVWELRGDLRPGKSSNAGAAPRKRDAKPVNEHLIGATGEVVALSDDDDRPMKVRLGRELWPARATPADDTPFPAGTRIEVTAVNGPIVLVRRSEPEV